MKLTKLCTTLPFFVFLNVVCFCLLGWFASQDQLFEALVVFLILIVVNLVMHGVLDLNDLIDHQDQKIMELEYMNKRLMRDNNE